MKLIFSLFLFLSISSLVHAQWTTNGANTITSTTNSVGIGTTTPVSPLQVQISNLGLNITGGFRNSNNGAGNGTTTAGTAVGIGFLNELNGNWWKAAIVHERTNAYGVGNLHFLVNNSIDNSTVTLNDAKMTIQSSGNVGIGTTTPAAKLEVYGTALVAGNNANIDNRNGNLPLTFLENTGKMLIGWNRTQGAGETDFISNQGGGSVGGFAFYNHSNTGTENQVMWLTGDGRLMIGLSTGNTGNNKLAVGGGIIAEAVTVKLQSAWPDYVFKKDYQLPSLQEVKTYIDQNQHLPEVPSEQQISKDGLNLGEMNKLLMKKVEELTLYMIEMKSENEEIKKELKKLKKR
ncbi:hypothetical protein G7092_21725 [Mucilaginibacter sp. HC2]|uniref:hypothetical protein n=1 Tax=Mucilaginibacter inviolabilis TaxID=2714892 RepID=UPI001409994A|nr:hypothetical protein [Mucilaginibacter inviolabilis]NHA06444.1 hypothetical protein [Mucilaginibacter inviolabilis]